MNITRKMVEILAGDVEEHVTSRALDNCGNDQKHALALVLLRYMDALKGLEASLEAMRIGNEPALYSGRVTAYRDAARALLAEMEVE